MKKKLPKQRNPYVLAMTQRASGAHKKLKKAERAKAKLKIKKQDYDHKALIA